MNVGNYVVGFFRGVVKEGDYLRFQVADNPEGEGFIQLMNYRLTRDDGTPTIEGELPAVGDKVLVRVFEEPKSYMRDGERKMFVARRVMGVTVLSDSGEGAA